MNIEIANRLVQYRKQHNLSQEELAAKLGISRQAVSKWERAEASPDTDNLIMLSRIYGVTLDELLFTEEEVSPVEANVSTASSAPKSNVHIGFDGIHVKDEKSEVHVSWKGIHVVDNQNEGTAYDDGSYVWNGETHPVDPSKKEGRWIGCTFPFLITLGYLLLGFLWNLWHPGWLLFFAIPIFFGTATAVRHHAFHMFPYPVFVVLVYLLLGFEYGYWHPGWVIFLTIPLYYGCAEYLDKRHIKKQTL